jgi:hypothetical protein
MSNLMGVPLKYQVHPQTLCKPIFKSYLRIWNRRFSGSVKKTRVRKDLNPDG